MYLADFPFVDTVLKIVKSANDGQLTRIEFNRLWPANANGIKFFDQIYDDVADAVDHFPSKFMTAELDMQRWLTMDEHGILQLDIELLTSSADLSSLLQQRIEYG